MITAARRIVLAITGKCSERKGYSYAAVVTAIARVNAWSASVSA